MATLHQVTADIELGGVPTSTTIDYIVGSLFHEDDLVIADVRTDAGSIAYKVWGVPDNEQLVRRIAVEHWRATNGNGQTEKHTD